MNVVAAHMGMRRVGGAMVAPRVALVLLLLPLVALVPDAADAHPGGRSSFARDDSGGIAFLLAATANVTRAGEPFTIHLELRESASHALLDVDVGRVRAARHPLGAPHESLPLEVHPEGKGRFVAQALLDREGEWAVEVWLDGSREAASFRLTAYPTARAWADFLPMARDRHLSGEAALVRFALLDPATGAYVPDPGDVVLVVERWSELHEERLDRFEVAAVRGADGLHAAPLRFPEAGAYDLRVASPTFGLTGWTQPAFDVHVDAAEAPLSVESAADPPPPGAGTLWRGTAPGVAVAGVGLAFAAVAWRLR